ncbi:unnamed protein product, partial [Anisakis simplex]|uniref:Uncharacterized protein n=1 Tax=Anisakis simplex TaxID=6269 RepID=A0A0M3KB14_ANISI
MPRPRAPPPRPRWYPTPPGPPRPPRPPRCSSVKLISMSKRFVRGSRRYKT